MNAAPEQPDWDRLPHDPVAFFGLSKGFDRRDLKRSYNRFLKRFKPEKFPAEFQRIRAAYESLDKQLRYGEQVARDQPAARYEWMVPDGEQPTEDPAPSSPPDDRGPVPPDHQREPSEGDDPSPEPSHDEEERDRPSRPRSRPLYERVRTESPEDLYAELRRTELKQPYHFYCLAVLSDLVEETERSFLDWVLTGLEDFPKDPALLSLLHAYLRTPVPVDRIAAVLVEVSRIVSNDRFYSLTEQLWDELLVGVPFKEFRQTLVKCERNIRDHRVTGRLVFYVHVLRRALFRGSRKWIAETFEMVDEHLTELPPHLEYDLEFLGVMREYLRHRTAFRNGHPLREEIDQLFQDYCERDEFGGEQAFLAFQSQVVDRIDELLQAFPTDEEQDFEYLFDVWKWLHFEVRERTSDGPEDFEVTEPFVHSVYDMLQSLEQETKRTSLGRMWGWSSWLYLFAQGLGYVGPFLFVLVQTMLFAGSSGGAVIGILLGLVVGGVGGHLFANKIAEPRWNAYCAATAAACFTQQWRRSIAGFLLRTHAPIWVTGSVVDHLVKNVDGLGDGNIAWLPDFLDGDPALILFSTALPFVK